MNEEDAIVGCKHVDKITVGSKSSHLGAMPVLVSRVPSGVHLVHVTGVQHRRNERVSLIHAGVEQAYERQIHPWRLSSVDKVIHPFTLLVGGEVDEELRSVLWLPDLGYAVQQPNGTRELCLCAARGNNSALRKMKFIPRDLQADSSSVFAEECEETFAVIGNAQPDFPPNGFIGLRHEGRIIGPECLHYGETNLLDLGYELLVAGFPILSVLFHILDYQVLKMLQAAFRDENGGDNASLVFLDANEFDTLACVPCRSRPRR